MRWILIVMLFPLFMAQCSRESEVMDIDEDRLVGILVDLHFIEAALSTVNVHHRDSIREAALEECAQLHQVSVAELKEELIYVDQRPPYQREIYKRVLDTLQSYMSRAEDLSARRDTSVARPKPKRPKSRKQ